MAKKEPKEITIETVRQILVGGEPVKIGTKITMPEPEARALISMGKAVVYTSKPATEKPTAGGKAAGGKE